MNTKDILGKCPKCEGNITEGSEKLKGYGCSNWNNESIKCNLIIWKNFYGKKINKTMAKALLDKGKTPVIKGWVSKRTGNEFEAALKLEETAEGYRVLFDFDK